MLGLKYVEQPPTKYNGKYRILRKENGLGEVKFVIQGTFGGDWWFDIHDHAGFDSLEEAEERLDRYILSVKKLPDA